MPARLELRGICKTFPGTVAVDHASLTVRRGSIHAVVGENGAGKTTLMRIAFGMIAPDAGSVMIDGTPINLRSPNDAIAVGIGMVHQHAMHVGNFTVLENMMLGHEPTSAGVIDWTAARAALTEAQHVSGFHLEADAVMDDLGAAQRQQVDIVATLARGADTLILDEPTALLLPHEVSPLFEMLRSMRDGGSTIVFISHKLDEVLTLADEVTVMRHGRVVAHHDLRTTTVTREQLALDIVGDELPPVPRRAVRPSGAVALDIRDVSVSESGRVLVDHVSLEVNAGAVLGIAGVAGNGQTELLEAIMGLRPATGRIDLDGRDLSDLASGARRRLGLAYVPEDRFTEGLLLEAPLWENRILGHHNQAPASTGGLLTIAQAKADTADLIREFEIATPSVDTAAGALSGGNQQKLLVGRELRDRPTVLIAAQPTRGVDVGAQAMIWERIREACQAGMAVILVTSDLDELLTMSDRVAVMARGRISTLVEACDLTPESLGMAMVGLS